MFLKFLDKIGRKKIVLDRGPSHPKYNEAKPWMNRYYVLLRHRPRWFPFNWEKWVNWHELMSPPRMDPNTPWYELDMYEKYQKRGRQERERNKSFQTENPPRPCASGRVKIKKDQKQKRFHSPKNIRKIRTTQIRKYRKIDRSKKRTRCFFIFSMKNTFQK